MKRKSKTKNYFQQIRVPQNYVRKSNIIIVVILLACGATLGAVTMLSGLLAWPWIIEILQSLGFWIFLISLISCYSPAPKIALIRALVFLVSMSLAYYLTPLALYGVLGITSFVFWVIASVLVSLFIAPLLWYARGKGRLAAIFAALPFTVLFLEIISIVFLTITQKMGWTILGWGTVLLDCAFAAILLVLLPQSKRQRLLSFFVALAVAIAIFIVFETAQS